MKQLFIIYLITVSLTAFGQKYSVDVKSSSVGWTGHAETGVYSPKGIIKVKSGAVTITNGKLTAGTVTVDMASLQQDNSEMQEHLRGKDFFDVAEFPEATLSINNVNGSTASGFLTIKGVSQPISFKFLLSELGGKTVIRATAVIDRTKYGIKYNSASYFQDLGSYAIRNTFEIEVVLQLS